MLLLKRHLIDLVRAGKKRQTIRLWKTRRVRPGQIAFTPGLGRLLITAVDELPALSALTAADARADGFPSKKSLLAEIRAIYGTPLPQGRRIFRIQFQWPPPAPVAESAARLPAPRPRKTIRRRGMSQKDRLSLRHFILSRAPH